MGKTHPKKTDYMNMPKAQRQQLNEVNNERRKAREDGNYTIATRRKAKAAAYIRKKRLLHKQSLLEIAEARKEESQGRITSAKLMDWYKTMIKEEHRINTVKHEMNAEAQLQKKVLEVREQALFDKEIELREMKINLTNDIKEVVD